MYFRFDEPTSSVPTAWCGGKFLIKSPLPIMIGHSVYLAHWGLCSRNHFENSFTGSKLFHKIVGNTLTSGNLYIRSYNITRHAILEGKKIIPTSSLRASGCLSNLKYQPGRISATGSPYNLIGYKRGKSGIHLSILYSFE